MPIAHRFLPALLLAAVAAGCAPSVGATPPAPTPDTPTPDTPTEPASLSADWTDDGVVVTLDNGWVVRHGEGDAPLLCVHDGDGLLGDVELGKFPLGGDLISADDLPSALLAHGRDYLAGMQDDRAVGCRDFTFEVLPTTAAVVDGGDGVRTGFVLRDDTGATVERVIVHVAIRDGTMWTVTAAAYVEDGGCLPPEQDFEPATLETFEPSLDALVRGTPLPATAEPTVPAQPLADGDHIVRAVIRADGMLDVTTVELLSGEEAVAAARADGEIGPQDDLPNDIYLRDTGLPPALASFSTDALIELIDCAAVCRPVTVDRDAFLSRESTPFNGDSAVFEVAIVDGEVTTLTEVYLP